MKYPIGTIIGIPFNKMYFPEHQWKYLIIISQNYFNFAPRYEGIVISHSGKKKY